MAVKTKEEIINSIKARVGEEPDDETIAFLEDVSDTLDDFESRINGSEDWRTRYDENDKMWRKKYTDRFFNSDPNSGSDPNPDAEPEKVKKFEDLFTVKEN